MDKALIIIVSLMIPALVFSSPRNTRSTGGQFVTRQEKEVPSNIFKNLEKTIASSEILSLIVPIIIKIILAPLNSFLRAMSRSLLLVGVISYMLSGFIPILFGFSSQSASGSVQKRFISEYLEPITSRLGKWYSDWTQNEKVKTSVDFILDILKLKSNDCKDLMACRMGSVMAKEFPTVSDYLVKGTFNFIHLADNTSQILVQSMNSKKENETDDVCQEMVLSCPALARMENYLYKSDEKSISRRMALLLNEKLETTTIPSIIWEATTTATNSKLFSNLISEGNTLTRLFKTFVN